MYKIFGYIGLGIVLLAPYVYFFVTYSNMKKEIAEQKVTISKFETANKALQGNIKEKDEVIKKCQESCKKISDTASKIDKHNAENSATKDKIDKVIDSKKKKEPKKEKVSIAPENLECRDTKKYVKLINELYK